MKTWPDPVAHHASERPNSAALITQERTWNWAEWDRWTSHIAGTLLGEKRVALCAEESPVYLATLVGALRAGATVVPLSTRWPGQWIQESLELVRPDVCVADGERGTRNVTCNLQLATFNPKPGTRNPEPGTRNPESETQAWEFDRQASIVFTSGSSGSPKSAVHTLGNHYWSAVGVNQHVDLDLDSRWLLNLPLYHVAGLAVVFRSLLAGSAIVLPDPEMSLKNAIEEFRPTHLSLIGTQLVRLLSEPDVDLSSVEAIVLGGSRIPDEAVKEAARRRWPVLLSYGLTEMASTVTVTGSGDGDIETSGRPLQHREVKISPDSEIFVRGETLFKGYLTADGIEDPRDSDGWFATGDRGTLDEEERLVVEGRKDLRIISGGENIQAEAVEAALLRLPFVDEAVVVPVEDAEFGQRPFAFIRTRGTAALDFGQIRKLLEEELPRFAIPVGFEGWEGAQGMKPDRVALAVWAQEVYDAE